MTRTVDFQELEEARQCSGLFFARCIDELGISERTWYRWKSCGKAPEWAYKIVCLMDGDLTRYGWKHWRIENGVLYCDQLNRRYHHWTPGKMLSGLYQETWIAPGTEAINDYWAEKLAPPGPAAPHTASGKDG